jgi:hypothetical protein
MKKKESIEKKDLSELSILEVITECGILKIDITSVAYLLADRTDKNILLQSLSDPESEESEAYRRGLARGKFDITSALHKAAELGYNDSYHALSAEQKDAAISQKIKENFGLE